MFQGVGLAIACAYFLISVIGLVTEDRFTPEFLVKFFAKLVISVAVIIWSEDIIVGLVDFGNALTHDVASVARNGSLNVQFNFGTETYDGVDGVLSAFSDAVWKLVAGIFGIDCTSTQSGNTISAWSVAGGAVGLLAAISLGLSVMVDQGILALVSLIILPIIRGCVFFVQITRLLELYVRGAFLPIASGVMADDGWKGAGGRYIRKILALATQNAVIVLTMYLSSAMILSFYLSRIGDAITIMTNGVHSGNDAYKLMNILLNGLSKGIETTLMSLVVAVAGIAFMFKSISVVNDLWGC
jgi:hypothetical protein